MKKLFTALLITAVIFLASCMKEAEIVPEYEVGTMVHDVSGMKLYIGGDIEPESPTVLSYIKDTYYGDLALKRFDDIEERFKIEILYSPECPSPSQMQAASAAQINNIDVVITDNYYGGDGLKASGVILPISEVSEYIDVHDSDKWGSPYQLEIFAWEDDIYGVVPNAWPEFGFMSADFVLALNIDMITDLGMTDPREYFENAQWTPDRFEQCVIDYTQNNDGGKIYGFSTRERHFFDMALRMYGVDFAIKDGDTWSAGYFTEPAYNAVDWVRKMLFGNYRYTDIYIENIEDTVQRFVDGGTAMGLLHMNYAFSTYTSSGGSSAIANSGITYACLPFPSLDGKSVHSQYQWTINGIMFASWKPNYLDSAMIISELFEPFDEMPTKDDLITAYNKNLFFDMRDVNMIMQMAENARYLFHEEGVHTLNEDIITILEYSSGRQAIDKYAGEIERILTEEVIPVRRAMLSVFDVE